MMADEEECCTNGVDFTQMPNIIWVEIMSFLPLSDRYKLSMTCQALYGAFNHPSLWHTVDITLLSGMGNCSQPKMVIPDKYYQLVTKFGHFFQNLTLTVIGKFQIMPRKWADVIVEVGRCCRLEKLTLDIGEIRSRSSSVGISPHHPDVYALLSFVRHAFRLKHFVLLSWPMHPSLSREKDLNILQALMQNDKIQELEMLSLYWEKKKDWVTRNAYIPSLEETKLVVHHFKNLQQLSLRSNMIDSELIESLTRSEHAKLKLLQVFVVYSAHDHNLQIPEIASSSWVALRRYSPRVAVECKVMSRVPTTELAALLKPEVPVVSLTFLKYSRCDCEMLMKFSENYYQTLTKFVDFTDAKNTDDALQDLVYSSPHLTYLVYHGCVQHTTVQSMAHRHGTLWRQFEFNKTNIITQDPVVEDEDVVIGQRESGDFYLRDLVRFHENVAERQRKLDLLCSSVSQHVGYTWEPIRNA